MFEWDPDKNVSNREKHGVAFEDIVPIFRKVGPKGLLLEDRRRDYGETRLILLCPFKSEVYHVTFTRRQDRVRLISARRASRREVLEYERRRSDQGGPHQ